MKLSTALHRQAKSYHREFTSSNGARFRIGPRRDNNPDLQIIPLPGAPINPKAINEILATIATKNNKSILTSALYPSQQKPFLAVGFQPIATLKILGLQLESLKEPKCKSKRMKKSELTQILRIDSETFHQFWQLDSLAFQEICDATPRSHCRVIRFHTESTRKVIGYAVSGRTDKQGFLQRLAVDPEYQRSGFGQSLVADSLNWLLKGGATSVLVNTQPENSPAISFYEPMRFTKNPSDLAVLGFRLKSL